MKKRRYEESVLINADTRDVFAYADDPSRFSSHMSESSWMMGGGRMDVETDDGHGQRVGSHIRLSGNAFGISLFLDEVVTQYEPPNRKTWQTVGTPKLLVIGHYQMGLEINAEDSKSRLRVFIDYELPLSWRTRWLGYLFGRSYARWCVRQMLRDVPEYFAYHPQITKEIVAK
jgi:hypothetical protein